MFTKGSEFKKLKIINSKDRSVVNTNKTSFKQICCCRISFSVNSNNLAKWISAVSILTSNFTN